MRLSAHQAIHQRIFKFAALFCVQNERNRRIKVPAPTGVKKLTDCISGRAATASSSIRAAQHRRGCWTGCCCLRKRIHIARRHTVLLLAARAAAAAGVVGGVAAAVG